jgi:hypothetical protein
MKKQLFRAALLLCMCLCLLPVGVMAGETVTNPHTHDEITFAAWNLTDSLPSSEGSYYLTQDVTISKTWEPADKTVLDLNGHNITYKNEEIQGSVIKVNENVTFSLYDCNEPENSHKFRVTDSGLWVEDNTDGTETMYGGVISGGTGSLYAQGGSYRYGGGVFVDGTFCMYGGIIAGNTAGLGGGVYVDQASTFCMYGGAIVGNTATGGIVDGGGAYVNLGATFRVSGTPVIVGNIAETLEDSKVVSTSVDNVSMLDVDIYVIGTLGSDAAIGVTEDAKDDTPDHELVIFPDEGSARERLSCFFSDEPDHALYLDGKTIKQHKFTSASGYKTCGGCGHSHTTDTLQYTANGAVLTETCKGDTSASTAAAKSACTHLATATVSATGGTFTGSAQAATVTYSPSWSGGTLSITYKQGDSQLNSAPTAVGTYTASITIGNETASVEYTIRSAYTINYTDETISYANTHTINTLSNGNGDTISINGTIVPNTTYYIHTVNDNDSGWTAVDIPVRPSAPTGLTTTSVSAQGSSDGKISGVTTDMEYASSTSGPWTTVSGTEVTGLSAGTYYVRYTATDSSFASNAATVTVGVKASYYPTQKPTSPTKPDDTDQGTVGSDDTGCPSLAFSDLNTSLWYHACVDYVLNMGLMEGMSDTTFRPNGTLTRAMMVQILYNKAGRPEVTAQESPFTDVSLDAWYADAIVWGERTGVIEGYGDGTFGPGDYVTREQMAAMFWRYEGRQQPTQETLDFTDAADVSGWALDALLWANENGIITGMGDGTLAPRATATRAQVAQMLMNYLQSK